MSVFGRIFHSQSTLWRLVFGFLPLGIACILGLYAVSLEEEIQQNRALKSLDQDLHEIIRTAEPEIFYRRHFQQFRRVLFSRAAPQQALEALYREAQSKWDLPFDAFLFDADGRLVTPATMPVQHRETVQIIWEFMRQVPRGKNTDPEPFKRSIAATFGLGFQYAHIAKQKRRIFPVRTRGLDGVGFWDSDGKPGYGGLLLISWNKPPQRTLLWRVYKARPKGLLLASCDRTGNVDFFRRTRFTGTFKQMIFRRLVIGRETWWSAHNCIWVTAPAGDLSLIAARRETRVDFAAQRRHVLLFFLLIAPSVLLVGYNRIILEKNSYLSIKTKLIALFLFAIVIPLLGVSFLGFRTLRDRQDVLVFESYKASRELLASIDAEFPQESAQCLTEFRQLRDDPHLRTSLNRVLLRAKTLRSVKKLARFEVRDISGNILSLLETPGLFDRIRSMFDAIAMQCIERNLADRMISFSEKKPMNQAELMMRMVVESPEMGFTYITDRPDRIHEIKFGSYHSYYYWDVFRDKDHPAAFITMAQMVTSTIEDFLRRQTHQFSDPEGAIRVIARRDEDGITYPAGAQLNARLIALMEKVKVGQQPVYEKITWENTPYLVTGFPTRNIDGHTLLALRSESHALRGIATIRRMVILGILLALALATLTGAVMADTFLSPINELSKGMQALRERNGNYQIPEQQLDELGDLAITFNRMIIELKELHLAKIVQESLFPSELPAVPGFSLGLSIETASDLGGDYGDILPMADGKTLFIIGDVTGHGVSSALLVAMAKAIVFQFSLEQGSISSLLTRLNYIIFHLLKKRKLMTFFAGTLDPQSCLFRYSNAGHPFPLVCRPNGRAEYLEIAQYPLGLSQKRKDFEEREIHLTPGTTLLFYSDGLVESVNPQGEPFSYTRLAEILSRHHHLPVEQLKQVILQEAKNHRQTNVLEDDITLLILQRHSTPESRNGCANPLS
jgi:serine phosphatase RsbU (regulator of sigma subunit)